MKAAVINLGEFITKGLAPNNNKRNNPQLITATGAMIYEGGLASVQDLTAYQNLIDLSAYAPIAWPYPQLFACVDTIVLCLETRIFEVEGYALVEKINGLTVGYPWTLIDFHSFLYMSNGQVGVVRDPLTFYYSKYDPDGHEYPIAMASCDFNGQVLLGGTPVDQAAAPRAAH